MENHLVERIFNKLDEIQQSVAELDKKMAVHDTENKSAFKLIQEQQDEANVILDEHVKRTLMLEDRMDKVEAPKQFHKQLLVWFWRAVAGLTALAGLIYTVHEMLSK
jgi:hypothetical protein